MATINRNTTYALSVGLTVLGVATLVRSIRRQRTRKNDYTQLERLSNLKHAQELSNFDGDVETETTTEHWLPVEQVKTPPEKAERAVAVTPGGKIKELVKIKKKETRPIPKSERRRFIAMVAREAKAVFGVPKQTEANRLAVGDRVRKIMKEHGHRASHIARDAPLATELVFAKSSSDREAERFRYSDELKENNDVLPGPWEYTWGWLLGKPSHDLQGSKTCE